MLIVWWAWNFKTTSSSCSGSRNSLTRNPRAGGWELEKSTPLPKLRRRGRRLTTNKKVNDTLVRDWNSWWSLVRDKNHVMGDECSCGPHLMGDYWWMGSLVLILIFPTPTGREMNMTQWRLDMGPPWVRGALEAHFGALVDGLTIIGGEDFAHIHLRVFHFQRCWSQPQRINGLPSKAASFNPTKAANRSNTNNFCPPMY